MSEPSRPTRSVRVESTGDRKLDKRAYAVLSLECNRPLAGSLGLPLQTVNTVALGRGSERARHIETVGNRRRLTVTVPDEWMSATHAIMQLSFGRWIIEDAGSKNGVSVNGLRVKRHVLADRDIVELGHTFLVYRDRAVPPEIYDDIYDDIYGNIDGPTDADDHGPGNIFRGPKSVDVPAMATFDAEFAIQLDNLIHVAQADIPILCTGASGTGKELMARAVHALSGRSGEFVAVNCGALPETLVESELFGHREGAFSGATTTHLGLIRSAHGGTLFLDEIADLRPSSQAALLRVLQEAEVRPVGSLKPVVVDVRPICATHRDLLAAVEDGAFRHDLYARIAGFRMHLPTVHERLEDRGLLVAILLRRLLTQKNQNITIDPDAARALFAYDWPLNVRELFNCLQTAVVLARDNVIKPVHLPQEVRAATAGMSRGAAPSSTLPLSEEQRLVRDQLIELLSEHQGNLSSVARAMGKARRQIQRWVKRFDLDPENFRG